MIGLFLSRIMRKNTVIATIGRKGRRLIVVYIIAEIVMNMIAAPVFDVPSISMSLPSFCVRNSFIVEPQCIYTLYLLEWELH